MGLVMEEEEIEKYAVANILKYIETLPDSFEIKDGRVYTSRMFYLKDLEPELSKEKERLRSLNP